MLVLVLIKSKSDYLQVSLVVLGFEETTLAQVIVSSGLDLGQATATLSIKSAASHKRWRGQVIE
jgi:hypothetical protein